MLRRVLAILQTLLLTFFWNVPLLNLRLAQADDTDIFGNNIAPNVMLAIDSSGSMSDSVGSLIPFNVSTTYTAVTYKGTTYETVKVYRKSTSGSSNGNSCSSGSPCYVFYANNISSVTSSSARTALTNNGTWTGSISGTNYTLYTGNYLNYFLCSSCDGIEPKIDIAKRVLTTLIQNTDGVRFGAMKLKSQGGQMISAVQDMTDTTKASLISAINSMTQTSVGTPTGDQLHDAAEYFKGNLAGYSSPIQFSCQANFVIVISDGLQNSYIRTLQTAATDAYTQDHSTTFTGTQRVLVHTVGFGIDDSEATAANSVLQQAATNGGGSFYSTTNSTQLTLALENAISQILAASFSFTNPTIPSTGASSGNRAYLASFTTNPSRPFWQGFLKAYTRDSNGLIQTDANNIPLESAKVWDAGTQLSTTTASSRTIYTYVNGSMQSFATSTSDIQNSTLAAGSSSEKDNIINFIRGVDTYDEDGDSNTTEQRAWKLGDIFHSTPVLVSPPFLSSTDSSYNTFKTTNASRTPFLLVGANDGMLHAFQESNGNELWAFIPPDQLADLKSLANASSQHQFYVDSSPIVADVKTGGAWKTIALFGTRRGGHNYYALNVTTPSSPAYLWSFTDSKMGETWSEPAIGKVKMSDNTEKWVAFFGGGYDTSSNNSTGKAFFVVDLSNGSKLWEYYKTTGATDDKQYMNFSIAASPAILDLNNDGYIDRVYIGDVGGQMWKFDLSAAATLSSGVVSNWTGKRVFHSSETNPPAAGEFYPTQAIYGAPSLANDINGNLWMYFGTGDRNHPNNTSSNRFIGIKENTNMTNGGALTVSNLTNVTSGSGAVTQGWYVTLNSNEKVLAESDVFNNAVFFTTFTPTSAASCANSSGTAKLYSVNLTTGDAALNLSTGAAATAGTAALSMAKTIGSGIPSRPEIIISGSGSSGNPYVITGTTNREIVNTAVPSVMRKSLAAWREVF